MLEIQIGTWNTGVTYVTVPYSPVSAQTTKLAPGLVLQSEAS